MTLEDLKAMETEKLEAMAYRQALQIGKMNQGLQAIEAEIRSRPVEPSQAVELPAEPVNPDQAA